MESPFKAPPGLPDFSTLVRELSVHVIEPNGTAHRVQGKMQPRPAKTDRRGHPEPPVVTLKGFRAGYNGLKAKVADPVSGELLDIDLSAFSDLPDESEVVIDFYFLPPNGPIVVK